MEVHRELGPGLLEAIYEAALTIELESRGFEAQCQMPFGVYYKQTKLQIGFRLDLLIEDSVVELKSVEKLEKVHHKQLLTYCSNWVVSQGWERGLRTLPNTDRNSFGSGRKPRRSPYHTTHRTYARAFDIDFSDAPEQTGLLPISAE